MNRIMTALEDERGVALVMAMIMLVAMTGLMLAFLSVSAFEPQISQNLATTAQARFVADAGLEWGFDQLSTIPAAVIAASGGSVPQAQTAYWNQLLAMPGPTPYAQISGAAPMQIPGPAGPMSAAFGTFVVQIRNDTNDSDRLITGYCQTTVAPCPANQGRDPGAANNDTNGIVIVSSTGTVRGVAKTVTAVVRRPGPLAFNFNGAVSFPGTQADVGFSSDLFQISGNDWKMPAAGVTPTAPDGVNPAVWGIAVSDAYPGNETTVETMLTAGQQDNVTGQRENLAQVGRGANTINTDPGMTSNAVHQFIHAMGQLPAGQNVIKMTSSQANPTVINSQDFGTATNPVLVHVKGAPDPTSLFTALTINGPVAGHGVLIVEDGDLEINGDFRWNGPVIVSGGYVGIGFMGGGQQQVYGAVISNEMATDEALGFREGLSTGSAKIRYSKEALDFAINGLFNRRSSMQMYNWREN